MSSKYCPNCRVTTVDPEAEARLIQLELRRDNLIAYAQFRLESRDWHGVSDAANDLRELDVEIRMAK